VALRSEAQAAAVHAQPSVVRWELPAIITASVVGLAISLYLTSAHYDQVALVCSVGGIIDCGSVTHSAYSELGATSLPISALGSAWFALAGGLAILRTANPAWRVASGPALAQLLVGAAGLGYVLYLVYVELVQLHRVCEWCTAVHVLVLAVFLLTVKHAQEAQPASD